MPQNPTQVLVGLYGGLPKPLAVDASGRLITAPVPLTITTTTVTIDTTNTFKQALAANANRLPGGSIVNNAASNKMQVFFGAQADATANKAIDLAAGATLFFSDVFGAGQVYRGEICITGTAADVAGVTENTAA